MKTTHTFTNKERFFIGLILMAAIMGAFCDGAQSQPCPKPYMEVQNIACSGQITFIAHDTCGGMEANGPYTYMWNGDPIKNTQSLTVVGSAVTFMEVTISNGSCQSEASFFGNISPTSSEPFFMEEVSDRDTICKGDTAHLFVWKTFPGPLPAVTWKRNNIVLSESGSTVNATQSGTYKATITGPNGCVSTATKKIVVRPKPVAAFTYLTPTTFCAGDSVTFIANAIGPEFVYQWKKGANFISGATDTSYTAKVGGNYRLQVATTYGCLKLSGAVPVVINCREGNMTEEVNTLDDIATIYPNPSTDAFTLKFSIENTKVRVIDLLGRVVEEHTTQDGMLHFGQNLQPGIYFVSLQGIEKTLKIIKQ